MNLQASPCFKDIRRRFCSKKNLTFYCFWDIVTAVTPEEIFSGYEKDKI